MKRIFLSYCWNDEAYADIIDNYFQQVGVKLIRDKRDLKYSASISSFAKKIKKSSYAICIISDEFLKRENCMYEIIELQKDDNFSKKICPIVISYTQNQVSLTPGDIEHYAQYWEKEIEEQEALINGISSNSAKEEQIHMLKKYQSIYGGIREFLFFLKDTIFLRSNEIDNNGIEAIDKNIFNKIGIRPKVNLDELYKITQINNIEDAEHGLANYLNTHLIRENEYYYFTRASVYEKFEYYDLAIYNYKSAYRCSKDFVLAYEAIINLYLKGLFPVDEDFDEIVNQLSSIDPKNTTLILAKGMLEIKKGQYKSAIDLFESALENAQSKMQCYIYNNIANSYEKLYDYEHTQENLIKAKNGYIKAITLNPNYYQALNNLSLLYLMRLKDIDLAEETIDECLRIQPTYNMGLNTKGLICEERKNFEIAIGLYFKSYKNSKNYTAPLNNIGRILDYEQNNDMCKLFYEIAYEIRPDSVIQNFNLGNYYRKYTDDIEAAEKYLSKALKISPDNILCNLAMGLLMYKNKKYKDSINYFSYAYVINPTYWASYFGIALCQLKLDISRDDILELLTAGISVCNHNLLKQLKDIVIFDRIDEIKKALKTFDNEYVQTSEQIVKNLVINPSLQLKDAYTYIEQHFYDLNRNNTVGTD